MQISISDSYRYREVLFNMVSQYLKIKYKRTFLGYLWSLLNPVLQLTVLSVVFSHVVRLGMKDYTLYLFSGLLVWTFFSNTVTACSASLLEGESYFKKIYLPKLIFPLSKLLITAIDFLFSLVALSVIGALLGFHFKATIALLPLAALSLMIFTLGVGLIVSVATVFFRDVQYLLGIFLNLFYFLTPIIYPLSALPEKYRPFMALNPVLTQVNLFQKLIYFGQLPTALEWATAYGIATLTFAAGLLLLTAFEEELVFRM